MPQEVFLPEIKKLEEMGFKHSGEDLYISLGKSNEPFLLLSDGIFSISNYGYDEFDMELNIQSQEDLEKFISLFK